MIRKPTIVLLGILALALLAGWVMEFSPWKPVEKAGPTATPRPPLISGMTGAEINRMEILTGDEQAVILVKDANGKFTFFDETSDLTPDASKVQQLLSELLALEVSNAVDPTSSLDVLGLDAATATITLQSENGLKHTALIGSKTPTGNGYYVQIDAQTPAVVNSAAVERVLGLADYAALTGVTATSTAIP